MLQALQVQVGKYFQTKFQKKKYKNKNVRENKRALLGGIFCTRHICWVPHKEMPIPHKEAGSTHCGAHLFVRYQHICRVQDIQNSGYTTRPRKVHIITIFLFFDINNQDSGCVPHSLHLIVLFWVLLMEVNGSLSS